MSTSESAPEFDYVIVGAGSAGCVLANRLTEDPAIRVCVIESGPPDTHPLIHIPFGLAALFNHPKLNWRFQTVPQPSAGNRAIYIPRGKTLGGTTSINSLIYTRGHPTDYDDWADLGNSGWSFREILPYFRRSENNETWTNSIYHGTGGPLNVTDVEVTNPLCHAFFKAAAMMQIPACPDFCGPTNEGYGVRQLTVKNGRRHSNAGAYLKPVIGRANLEIVTSGHVEKVIFDGRRARGVTFNSDGAMRRISARREVIIAGGAIGSPMLLMRSGIGPASELQRHGIEVLHASPHVGANLQDHISVTISQTDPTKTSTGLSFGTIPAMAKNVLQYAIFQTGLFASTPFQIGAFVKSSPSVPRPDLNFLFIPYNRSADGSLGMGHGYCLTAMVLRPKSRGTVMLTSADPLGQPRIDLGFLSQEDDLDLLRLGIRTGRQLLATPAFDPYRGQEKRPGDSAQSDEDLNAFIRETCATAFHPVGTCRMGSDSEAVVDPELRVKGVEGLRVVDASVMPTLIGGNPNAPTTMVAEKAADMILGRPALAPETRV